MVIVLISKIKQKNGTIQLVSNILLNKVVKHICDETTKQHAQCKTQTYIQYNNLVHVFCMHIQINI